MAQPQDAPWGIPPALVPKSVVDLFYQAALRGQVDIAVSSAEAAAIRTSFQQLGVQPPADLSKAPVTAYGLFLPAFEQFALFNNGGDQPFPPVSIAPRVSLLQAGNATAALDKCNPDAIRHIQDGRGDGSKPQNNDFTLYGATPTVCDILIVNALDAPITCAETVVGTGFPFYYPQILTPIDHGDPVEASNNVIPGRTCMPDGSNRFGIGLYRFQKGLAALHGTEGALKFTTTDPAAPQPIGVAWGLDYYNKPSMAATADLSQYNSLQAFYEATTQKSVSTYGEGKFGVNINCAIGYSSLNSPNKDDGHRVITVVIQPKAGIRETDADPAPAPSKVLPGILKIVSAALPKPSPQAPQPFVGAVKQPGLNKLPPNVVPFVNDDN